MGENERHLRVSDVFKRAIELPEGERDRFVVEVCGADTELLDEVRSLLRHDAPEPDLRITAEGPDTLPKTFGKYEVQGELGRGGMGVVWKAWDPHLDRHVALKFLPREMARNEAARRRFLREGRAASKLKHDGIATVYEAGEIDGRAYIAFEFVDGQSLTTRLEAGPLPAAEAVRVAIRAAQALSHAHERSVFHRDITSNNIMITRDGRVVIVDFGLAIALGAERLTRTGTSVGTMAYMSPEALRGAGGEDHAALQGSDIYGLGVTLYESLTGSVPFRAPAAPQLMYAIENVAPVRPGELVPILPLQVDDVVLRALAKQPAQRYATAAEFASELESLLQSGGLPDVPMDQAIVRRPPESTLLAPRRRPLWHSRRWLLAVPIVIALAAFVIWKRPQTSSNAPLASVAVLPFTVSGPDTDIPHWITAGLGQQLVTKLSKLEGVRVVTWASSQHFPPGPDRSVREIGRDLKVDGIVLVTLRREDGQLHGSVEIVESETEFVRWSGEFDGEENDLLTVETALARSAAEGIFGELSTAAAGTISTPPAKSAAAYELYLRGADELGMQTQEANASALALFERAVELDPQFADGHVGIGAVHLDRAFFGWGGQRSVALAEQSFQAALSIDAKNRFALRGLIQVESERGHMNRILELGARIRVDVNSNVDDLLAKAHSYGAGGLVAKSIPLYNRVIEIEPSNEAAHWYRTIMDAWSFQPDSCIAHGELFFSRFGDDPELHLWVAFSHETLGNIDEARVHYLRSINRFSENSNGYASYYAASFMLKHGMNAEANSILDRIIQVCERKLTTFPDNARWIGTLAICYSLAGRQSDFLRLARSMESTPATAYLCQLVIEYTRQGYVDDAARVLCIAARDGTLFNDLTGFVLLWGQHSQWNPPFPETEMARECVGEAREYYRQMAARY
jgi:serine/threonine-protein kinase